MVSALTSAGSAAAPSAEEEEDFLEQRNAAALAGRIADGLDEAYSVLLQVAAAPTSDGAARVQAALRTLGLPPFRSYRIWRIVAHAFPTLAVENAAPRLFFGSRRGLLLAMGQPDETVRRLGGRDGFDAVLEGLVEPFLAMAQGALQRRNAAVWRAHGVDLLGELTRFGVHVFSWSAHQHLLCEFQKIFLGLSPLRPSSARSGRVTPDEQYSTWASRLLAYAAAVSRGPTVAGVATARSGPAPQGPALEQGAPRAPQPLGTRPPP
jgi:hypothetical protein